MLCLHFGEPRTLVNPDEIADLVMNTVAPGTWDEAECRERPVSTLLGTRLGRKSG